MVHDFALGGRGGEHEGVLLALLEQEGVERVLDALLTQQLTGLTLLGGHLAQVAGRLVGLAANLVQLHVNALDRAVEALQHVVVHGLDLFVNLQLEIQSKRARLLNKLKDKMERKISETGLDATTRYELDTRLAGMKKHVKVCHGDFNPSNIIITPDGTPYVLDWSHVTQGNGAADAARTYLLFSLEGKKELAEKYMKLYCKKSDTARQYVQQWLPIVAASQSVKGKPEERDFLLSWVNVVEYQ